MRLVQGILTVEKHCERTGKLAWHSSRRRVRLNIRISNDEIKYTNIHTSTDIQHFQLPQTVFHATS